MPPASVPATYSATRASLHAVAEHVLAAALHNATGRIGLRPTSAGFGTPTFPTAGRWRLVHVDGVDLVVMEDGVERRAPLQSVGEAAAFVGIEPGAPTSVYSPSTPLQPSAPLHLDPDAVAIIHGWFGLAAAALTGFRDTLADCQPSLVQLWPEHFDVAVVVGEVNYGASPGDADHDRPYAYVGPWNREHLDGGYWNEPFGASIPYGAVRSAADMVAFFRRGTELLADGG